MFKSGERRLKLLTACSIVALSSAPSAWAQDLDGQDLDGDEDQQIDSIVVTALKRGEQNLIDVPAGINSISGEQIESFNADSLRDFLQLAPGVTLDTGSLSSGTATIGMRGLNSSVGSASVGFYLDDLPFSYININLVPDPNPYDLASVEVLKGPQSTLYGAGATGGVVILRTNDPVLNEFSGKLEAFGSGTEDGGGNYTVQGAVNVPLVEDKLAFRASASLSDNSGFIDDSFSGIPGVFPAPNLGENVNDEESLSFRGKLLFQPTDDLKINLIANFSRIEQGNPPFGDDALEFPFIFEAAETPLVETTGVVTDFDQFGATITYQTPWFEVFNALGFIDFRNDANVSASAFGFPSTFDVESLTNEFRLRSTHEGPFSWVLGAFYRNVDQNTVFDLSAFGLNDSVDVSESRQVSGFGEVALSLFDDRVEISGGASYFTDESTIATDFFVNDAVLALDPNATPFSFPGITVDTTQFAPKATIAFYPIENTTLYFVFSEGFRSGFSNLGSSVFFAQQFGDPLFDGVVEAETTRAYEIGAKGSFLDGMISGEVAFYIQNIDDTQQETDIATVNVVVNSGESQIRGVEWLVNMRPTDALTFGVSGTVVDGQFQTDSFTPGGLVISRDGQQVPLVPEFIFNANMSYDFAVPVAGLDGRLTSTLQHSSERENAVIGADPLVGDKITRVDARLEMGRDNWTVYVFGQNLSNEKGAITANGLGDPNNPFSLVSAGLPITGDTIGTRLRPRTIGAGVRVEF